jgi:hypothetical protein
VSPVGKQELERPHIALVDQRAFSQGSFALARFRAQDMTAKRFMVDNFARTGLFEPLGGGTVGFDLRHMKISPFEYKMLSLFKN